MTNCSLIDKFKTQKCNSENPEYLSKYLQTTYTEGFIFALLAKLSNVCMNKMLYFIIQGLVWKSCSYQLATFNKNRCSNRFEIIPVNYIFTGNTLHVNVILIDHQNREIELFEPYGASRVTQSCDKQLIDILDQMYPNYKVIFPEIFCPIGPQTVEKSGSCFIWSALYFYLRINCLQLSRRGLTDAMLDLQSDQDTRLVTYIKSYFRFSHTHNLIVGFACYVNDLVSELKLEPFARFFVNIHANALKNLQNSTTFIDEITYAYLTLDINKFVQILLDHNLYNSEINNIILSTPFLFDLLSPNMMSKL